MPGSRELIVALNSLGVGDLAILRSRLVAVKKGLSDMGQHELCERLDEAVLSLEKGHTAEYRRLINQVVSRLGHLRTP